jgi:hypothetical protein
VRVLGEEPGPGLPNQHAKACPRFQTMHCWCPPATGRVSHMRKTARGTSGLSFLRFMRLSGATMTGSPKLSLSPRLSRRKR